MGFGEWLKAERVKRGLSLRALAELAGISHISVDKAEKGGGMRDSTLELVVRALAGEHATDEELEDLLREARTVRAGLEMTREVDEELLQDSLMAYSGPNPILRAAKAAAMGQQMITAEEMAQKLRSAEAAGPVGGEGRPPLPRHGRGPRKGIAKIDE